MDSYHHLRSLIAEVRNRWTRHVALQVTARVFTCAAIAIAAGAMLDYLARPQGSALMALAVGSIVLALAAAALLVRQMPGRPSDRQVARFIEERAARAGHGELNDSLVSAIDAAERPSDVPIRAFVPLVIGDAVARLQALPPSEILPEAAMRQVMRRAAGGAVALLVVLIASVPFLDRAAGTARVRLFPGSVRVNVFPGNVRLAAGTPLRIRASVKGPRAFLTGVSPELSLEAGNERRVAAMTPTADGFEFTIGAVDRTFSYVVNAGAAHSDRFTVTALTAPRVERIDLHYDYPSFSGLPPRDERDGGDLYAPAGTRVRISIHTDKPIARGELALGHAPALPLRSAGSRTVDTELVLASNDSYRIRLTDDDGLHSRGEAEYFIRLMDDRPPDVRILRPSADQQITPLEEVPIEARADDDYGIATFELVYSVAGGPERVVPFEQLRGTNVQKIGTRLLPAEDLGVKPGDVITYYARARDIARGKQSTLATTDMFFLEVKPFNSEFVAAQSQGGGGAADPQIDSLIQAQKEIISSTWNVERRSAGGRSAEDVRAIAAAQSELKARAEQQLISRSSRSRGRSQFPQRQSPAPAPPPRTGGDPVAAAVDAMSKAVRQLETEQTKDALSHEMAALNGLLQAQAEVRRQQVMQQSNAAGSGGSNRADQDLSALFDKELQRQQRTNYETRPSVETQPDRAESNDAALDRIRDLARRQEDLNRRLADLAGANLNTEEMKRQLERLTREQAELRQQTEQLLRRNGDRPSASSAAGSTQAAGGRGQSDPAQRDRQNALQGAIDQMRSAASNLNRDDPRQAAANGQRAVEQLKRLEQQARSGAADRSGDAPSPEASQLAKQLEEARAIRDRVQRAEQQLREAEGRGRSGQGRADSGTGRSAQADGQRADGGRGQGEAPTSASNGGARGAGGGSGRAGGGNGGEIQRLRDEYAREMQRAQEALERLSGGQARSGANGSTPEEEQFSRSAPGTVAFKQDRSNWESLRRNLDSALERYEASVSDRLARTRRDDRFNTGGSDRVPDAYRELIAKYFESLAKKKP
jgi:hypothetical protein